MIAGSCTSSSCTRSGASERTELTLEIAGPSSLSRRVRCALDLISTTVTDASALEKFVAPAPDLPRDATFAGTQLNTSCGTQQYSPDSSSTSSARISSAGLSHDVSPVVVL